MAKGQQQYYSYSKKMEHNLVYRFTCEHCGGSSGEKSVPFRESGYLRLQTPRMSEEQERELSQLTFEKVRRELKEAKSKCDQGKYPEKIDGRCSHCGMSQSWMLGRFRFAQMIASAVGGVFGLWLGFRIGFLVMYQVSVVLGGLIIAGGAVLGLLLARGAYSLRIRAAVGKTKRVQEKKTPAIQWPEYI